MGQYGEEGIVKQVGDLSEPSRALAPVIPDFCHGNLTLPGMVVADLIHGAAYPESNINNLPTANYSIGK